MLWMVIDQPIALWCHWCHVSSIYFPSLPSLSKKHEISIFRLCSQTSVHFPPPLHVDAHTYTHSIVKNMCAMWYDKLYIKWKTWTFSSNRFVLIFMRQITYKIGNPQIRRILLMGIGLNFQWKIHLLQITFWQPWWCLCWLK
jgi:hypothetical protein